MHSPKGNFSRRYKAQQHTESTTLISSLNMKLFTIAFAVLGASASFNPFAQGNKLIFKDLQKF